MAVSESQKRANAKYKRDRTKSAVIRFYPSELPLWEWLNSQANKAGYIKQLIRDDMACQDENRTRLDTGARE